MHFGKRYMFTIKLLCSIIYTDSTEYMTKFIYSLQTKRNIYTAVEDIDE